MPSYTAPVKDMQFVLHDVMKITASDVPGYADLDAGFTAAVLDEAGKFVGEVIAPLNRIGEPNDVAGCVVFLASDLAKYLTGVTLDVNGGMLIH